mmetsp:Transcript_27297/g.79983  ORF Transcript_27297/g.79983 Transcript_27297/m.79983 type:complete len:207 (+) Transcript_27297:1062-1682(+)
MWLTCSLPRPSKGPPGSLLPPAGSASKCEIKAAICSAVYPCSCSHASSEAAPAPAPRRAISEIAISSSACSCCCSCCCCSSSSSSAWPRRAPRRSSSRTCASGCCGVEEEPVAPLEGERKRRRLTAARGTSLAAKEGAMEDAPTDLPPNDLTSSSSSSSAWPAILTRTAPSSHASASSGDPGIDPACGVAPPIFAPFITSRTTTAL